MLFLDVMMVKHLYNTREITTTKCTWHSMKGIEVFVLVLRKSEEEKKIAKTKTKHTPKYKSVIAETVYAMIKFSILMCVLNTVQY